MLVIDLQISLAVRDYTQQQRIVSFPETYSFNCAQKVKLKLANEYIIWCSVGGGIVYCGVLGTI